MKIRTDFVTNSSSSSFTVEVELASAEGVIAVDTGSSENSESEFTDDLRNVNEHLSSVKELASWLADAIRQDNQGPEETKIFEQLVFEQEKKEFIQDAITTFQSVQEIETITVRRRYDAWGEFADLIADSDQKLLALAKKYVQSTGIEKDRAKAEFITYVNSVTDARGYSFGANSQVSLYRLNGQSIDKLAKRLCSYEGPGRVTGVEEKRLNLKTGEYYDTSDFDLT